MSKWAKYKKLYRKEWEAEPELKSWIAPVLGDNSKARCKYCGTEIRAHLHDLKAHGATKKHTARCVPSVKSFAVPVGSGSGSNLLKDDKKRRERRTATYFASHTSINKVVDLSDITEEVGAFKLHRTKCPALSTRAIRLLLCVCLSNDRYNNKT